MHKGWWWRHIGLVFVIGLLTFNFTVVGKYASYPWWHQHDCDSDPLYVAQAVTLVNDGPFDYIHHPGAVVSSGHGAVYRLASSIFGWHPEYLDLRSTAHGVSAWDLLEQATRLSRWLSLIVFIGFVVAFYGLVFWITREATVTFLVTFFVATSDVALWHSRAIRPEIPSLLFSILALWIVVALGRLPARRDDRSTYLGTFVLGLLLALAIFSKIQVLPVVACLLILGLGRAWVVEWHDTQHDTEHRLRMALASGLVLTFTMPWWALVKPGFLTETYLESVGYFDRLVYGSLTASFVPLVAAALGLSLVGTVVGMVLNRRPGGSRVAGRLARLLTFLHLSGLGAVVGAYAVVAPASRTLSSYLGNTHHLIYGVISNIFGNVFGSGFLHHKTVDGNTASRIVDAHAKGDPLLGVNIVWLIGLMAAVALFRLVASKTRENRAAYRYILLLLGVGVAMDIVFTLRWVAQFNYYAMFSLVFYAIAMAWFLKLERQILWVAGGRLRPSSAVAILIFGLFLSHVGFRTYELVTAPRATAISDQSPKPMLDSSRQQNRHFWRLFESDTSP